MPNILIIHGPNLNMLGKREVGIYGASTLDTINQQIRQKAEQLNLNQEQQHETQPKKQANQQLKKPLSVNVACFQSNAEHELIEKIHASMGSVDYIIINPAAFTHTSVALRDALLAVNIPFVEVHLSNVHQREPFRQQSFFSDKAQAVICGCGGLGYLYALDFAVHQLTHSAAAHTG